MGSSADSAAQLAAQLEAALGFVLERDVDDRQIRQARGEGRHGLAAIRIAAHRVSLAREGGGVVVADGAFVFDDGDGLFHGRRSLSEREAAVRRRPHLVTFHPRCATKASRRRPAAAARNVTQASEVTAMSEASSMDRTYAGAQFGVQPGERWRRFLERVGTRSNDFAVAPVARALRLPASARDRLALAAAVSAVPEDARERSDGACRRGAARPARHSGTGCRSACCWPAGSPRRRCARAVCAASDRLAATSVRHGLTASLVDLERCAAASTCATRS